MSKICSNETVCKQFESLLISKEGEYKNFLFWKAMEDLKTEPKELKRREKSLVYFIRFMSGKGRDTIEFTNEINLKQIEKMIKHKKYFFDLKIFKKCQEIAEKHLGSFILEFLSLSSKSRNVLTKDQWNLKSLHNSKELTFLNTKEIRLSFDSNELISKSTHECLAFFDFDEIQKEDFLTFLNENGVKQNFEFWSDSQKFLSKNKINPKFLKHINKKYLKDNTLRLKSHFKEDFMLFFNNPKNLKIEDFPFDLFVYFIIEIEISLSHLVEKFIISKKL